MKTAEQQYLSILKHTLYSGSKILNERTNSHCLTTLNQRIEIRPDEFPLITTRKSYWKQAICEMICYIRGYTELNQFHSLGVHTWDNNAKAWINIHNPYGQSTGIIYGASAEKVGIDFIDVLDQIKNKPHDRGNIWNFWNPEYFEFGCLRPCMYSHQFNVLNNKLYLSSIQRSSDLPLGENFNMVQAWFLLQVMAQLTEYEAGFAHLTMVNCHIYENQVEGVKEQLQREPFNPPKFIFKKKLTLEDIMTNITKDNFDEYFEIQDYQYHPPIKYPFTV